MRFLFFLLSLCCSLLGLEPLAVYLTWTDSPLTTININAISQKKEESKLFFKKKEDLLWRETPTKEATPLPEGYHEYFLKRVELTGLTPGTTYEIRFGQEGSTYQFRTLPTQAEPIRFVVGGDIYHDALETVEEMNKVAATTNPHFALLGGDLAYSADNLGFASENGKRWIDFLSLYSRTMVTKEGNMIPLLPAIGNHEVKGRKQNVEAAPFFYFLFPTPGPSGYAAIDFGDTLSVLILDSDHTHPIEGEQTKWLEKTLKERENVKTVFALYHVPAYPCVRKFEGKINTKIRTYWVPLFEKYGLDVAFEHHDHAYKRTYPLKEGKLHAKGVVYLGDGGWGVATPRNPAPSKPWYLAAAHPTRHIILVTLESRHRSFQALDSQGNVFDHYSQGIIPSQPPLRSPWKPLLPSATHR